MNEITKGDTMSKKQYVKEYYDYSSGKDRRITKLVNDIKKLEEQKTENQILKVTWKEVKNEEEDTWYDCFAYDYNFTVNYDLRRNGLGWTQNLELIDRWGDAHHFDNEMGNYFYKDIKVELLEVPKHEEYVEECKFCFIHRGWYGVIESPCIEL